MSFGSLKQGVRGVPPLNARDDRMVKINKRSHFNMNRIHTYSVIDAVMDNPHLPEREARRLAAPPRRRRLRDLLERPLGRSQPVTFSCKSTPETPNRRN
jgi:hypothetical protein